MILQLRFPKQYITEMIFSDKTDEKTDSAICLIRSLDITRETAYVYIEELIKDKKYRQVL
jgi:hypothetical protein